VTDVDDETRAVDIASEPEIEDKSWPPARLETKRWPG
jgi:hypothetical protein